MTIDPRWLVGYVVATGVATTACLRIDADHCMFTGGDERCPSRACGAALEGHTLRASDPLGCVDVDSEPPDTYVHVKYGLLLAVTNDEGVESSESRPRTVEDVLRAQLGAGSTECEIDEIAAREAVDGTAAIWRRLEHLGVRKADAYLTAEEQRAIERLNALLDALLSTCGGYAGTSSGTTNETFSASSSASTSEGTATTEGPECLTSADCLEPTHPICMSEICVGCNEAGGNAACEMLSPETSACVLVGEDTGSCVQCTWDNPAPCTGETPVCDHATHTCIPCTAHEQCGNAACNFFTGSCLPDDTDHVVHVGGATPDFDDLTTAVAQTGDEVTIIVHASPMTYNESVTIDGGRVVALLGEEAGSDHTPPRWVRSSGDAPQLTVDPATTVLMDGLELIGNASSEVPGLLVDGGRAWIDRGRITHNTGGGIVAESDAELVVRNSFVGGNGSGGGGSHGLDVFDSKVSVLYSTIARNDESTVDSISCFGGMVDVRNSIVVGRDPNSIACPGIVIVDSALDEDIDGNVNVGAANLAWFTSGVGGDFHLTPAGAAVFANLALWTTGDPPTDIDGDSRPTTNDTPDFVGADIP